MTPTDSRQHCNDMVSILETNAMEIGIAENTFLK
jgi:hypothetical protein